MQLLLRFVEWRNRGFCSNPMYDRAQYNVPVYENAALRIVELHFRVVEAGKTIRFVPDATVEAKSLRIACYFKLCCLR